MSSSFKDWLYSQVQDCQSTHVCKHCGRKTFGLTNPRDGKYFGEHCEHTPNFVADCFTHLLHISGKPILVCMVLVRCPICKFRKMFAFWPSHVCELTKGTPSGKKRIAQRRARCGMEFRPMYPRVWLPPSWEKIYKQELRSLKKAKCAYVYCKGKRPEKYWR